METKELAEIFATMDIPESRKKITASNVRWLLRNLRVRNAQHTNINETIKALKEIARASR